MPSQKPPKKSINAFTKNPAFSGQSDNQSGRTKSGPGRKVSGGASPYSSAGEITSRSKTAGGFRGDSTSDSVAKPGQGKTQIQSQDRSRPESAKDAFSKTSFAKPVSRAGSGSSFKRSSLRKPAPSPVRAQERVNLPVPCAMVSRRASEAIRRDHLWVYASDIEQVEIGSGDAPGLIPVVDNRGIPLGTALYSPASQIALRMVSRELMDHNQWLTLLTSRMHAAIAIREPMLSVGTNACRLVFSEADQLPGIIVDQYAGIVVLQLLAKGLDNPETRDACVKALKDSLIQANQPLTIWERPDPRIRELEGLSAPGLTPLFSTDPAAPVSNTLFRLNGLSFHFDVNSGQKTGAFLDQRENYAAVESYANRYRVKKALDVCTYQGGFALHLGRVCEQVTGIDSSRTSLEVAERNQEANRKAIAAEVDWVEADAFEILRAWSEAPKREGKNASDWDMIVLDPPAFAKSVRAVEGALRGYKELNLRALMMIRSGGLLVTCSCSHHVSWADLEGAVASAAVDAKRPRDFA